jgi:hypothetical protein
VGIRLKQYKNGDYRIWSSTADSWLTERMTEQEAIEFLAERIQEKAFRDIRELRATFPAQYIDIYGNMIWNEQLKKKYVEFFDKEKEVTNANK